MFDRHLAQLNIARLRAPIDSPPLADFVANLERINALAESSDGFVWRCLTPVGDGPALAHLFGDDTIVNLSLWRDVAALHAFTYGSPHAAIVRRRKEWFERMEEASMVLWWVAAGHRPTLSEAKRRLDTLRAEGSSPRAFTFAQVFAADAEGTREGDDLPTGGAADPPFGEDCPAY